MDIELRVQAAGRVIKWYKRPGDYVPKLEPVACVEDASGDRVDVCARAAGYLTRRCVARGDWIGRDGVIAKVRAVDGAPSAYSEVEPAVDLSWFPVDSLLSHIVSARGQSPWSLQVTPSVRFGISGAPYQVEAFREVSEYLADLGLSCNNGELSRMMLHWLLCLTPLEVRDWMERSRDVERSAGYGSGYQRSRGAA